MYMELFGTDSLAIRRSKYNTFRNTYSFYNNISDIPLEKLSISNFLIISGKTRYENDFELLRQRGVDLYRISFYEKVEWRKGCSFLGQYLWFGRSYYRSCVYRIGEYLYVDYSGNIKNDFRSICQKWEDTLNRWRNNEPTPCDGCVQLKEKIWPKKLRMKSLSLYGGFKGEHCNFRCIYCDAVENLKQANIDGPSMVDAINAFVKINKSKDFSIALSAGEITVSPYKKEIFNILMNKNIRVSVFSNGMIFDENIFHVLQKQKGSLNISLDSGTPETFYKIKRVNQFQKVLENISRYSESKGRLELKYIILEGINDNYVDVNGFLDICKKYASSVRLSCDKFRYQEQLSNETILLLKYIVDKCKTFSLPVSFSYSQFNDFDCERIKQFQGIM